VMTAWCAPDGTVAEIGCSEPGTVFHGANASRGGAPTKWMNTGVGRAPALCSHAWAAAASGSVRARSMIVARTLQGLFGSVMIPQGLALMKIVFPPEHLRKEVLQAIEHVTGPVLWANLHLLFWLSLIPFTTAWMGENHFATVPTALYGVMLLQKKIRRTGTIER